MNQKSNNKEKQEKLIGRVIANTLTRTRPCTLIEVARDIETLKKELGSLDTVSKIVGISTDMLRQFLSVKQLTPEVRKLVEERKLDSVTVVHKIRNFNKNEQKTIAKEVIDGRLTSGDVRALVALKSKLSNLSITELISRVVDSKDIKVYVAHFRIPSETKEGAELSERFEKIIGKDDVVSFNIENHTGTLEITRVGLRKLRETAKKNNLSLRQFVDRLVEN